MKITKTVEPRYVLEVSQTELAHIAGAVGRLNGQDTEEINKRRGISFTHRESFALYEKLDEFAPFVG